MKRLIGRHICFHFLLGQHDAFWQTFDPSVGKCAHQLGDWLLSIFLNLVDQELRHCTSWEWLHALPQATCITFVRSKWQGTPKYSAFNQKSRIQAIDYIINIKLKRLQSLSHCIKAPGTPSSQFLTHSNNTHTTSTFTQRNLPLYYCTYTKPDMQGDYLWYVAFIVLTILGVLILSCIIRKEFYCI